MASSRPDDENPFATRFTRPGALPYVFPPGVELEHVLNRLREHQWRGQVVGPHGTGKSTLICALMEALPEAGREPVLIRLTAQQRRPQYSATSWGPTTQVIVDGYEQLRWWARWRLLRLVRRAGCGLLVTTHADQRLPTILETRASEDVTFALAKQLLGNTTSVDDDAIRNAFAECDGNVRECFFLLYDWHEVQSRSQSTSD